MRAYEEYDGQYADYDEIDLDAGHSVTQSLLVECKARYKAGIRLSRICEHGGKILI